MFTDLERHNLTTIGGRSADVGIGGFVLGGGFSHLSPAYGLAKDNVFQYEVWTASISNIEIHTFVL
jgi:FAD/FMN-containing dehydrogenase